MQIACYVWDSNRPDDDRQRADIRRWLDEQRIGPKRVEWYADHGASVTGPRPEFERLQDDIRHGKVEAVVLWKLDRLGHRLGRALRTLAGWCERELRIVFVAQQLELECEAVKVVAALLLGLAEIDEVYRRERQTAGIAAAKRRGAYSGRKPGSTKGRPERARELRDEGKTAPEIAEALGVSQRTVFRYLGTS